MAAPPTPSSAEGGLPSFSMSIDPATEPPGIGMITATGTLGTVVSAKKVNDFRFCVVPSSDPYIARIAHNQYFHTHGSIPAETAKEKKEQLEWLFPYLDTCKKLDKDTFNASIVRGYTYEVLHTFPRRYAKEFFSHHFNGLRMEKVLPEERRTDGQLETFTAEGMKERPPCDGGACSARPSRQ